MGLLTPAQLVEAVFQHGLLEGEPRDNLPALAAKFPDARELAQDLLRRDWLTAYQVNQLFLGRGKDLVLGPYIFLERLGEGGMGQVFKARQRSLNRLVALKVIKKDYLNNPRVIKRFEREMRAVGQVRHPHIVHAYDADQFDGVCFIAMEFMDGLDFARLVKQNGPLLAAQACDYIRQAALGLQHAHEQGLVHRDIKPANLFLTRAGVDRQSSAALPRPSGTTTRPSGVLPRPGGANATSSGESPWGLVKVLDLGLARWTDADNERTHLTQLGTLMGTPDYIAPEQARNSGNCDIRADLYSLGCTFYFLLTGQVPFPIGTLTEKLLHHQMDEPEPVEQVRRRRLLDPARIQPHGKPAQEFLEVPAAAVAVLRALLAKKPEDRFQTPGELAQQLDQILNPRARARPTRPMPRPPLEPAKAASPPAPSAKTAAQKPGTPKAAASKASTAQANTAQANTAQASSPKASTAKANIPKPSSPKTAPAVPASVLPAPETKPTRKRRQWAVATVGAALLSGMLLSVLGNRDNQPQAAPATPGQKAVAPKPSSEEDKAEALKVLQD